MWADNSSGKTSPVGPVCNGVSHVRYALQPVFWSSGPCWTTDRSSSVLSASQFSCCSWLSDGVDAVSAASRKLRVFDAAVTFGWHSADGGLAAGKVPLRIVDGPVRCCWRLSRLKPGWGSGKQKQVSVARNPNRREITQEVKKTRELPAAIWETFFLSSVRSYTQEILSCLLCKWFFYNAIFSLFCKKAGVINYSAQ